MRYEVKYAHCSPVREKGKRERGEGEGIHVHERVLNLVCEHRDCLEFQRALYGDVSSKTIGRRITHARSRDCGKNFLKARARGRERKQTSER